MKFGRIELSKFEPLAKLPQKAASAWCATANEIVGVTLNPVLFVGEQQVKGTNYIFIAEQITVTRTPQRKLVKVVINEFGGEYKIVSIENLF